MGSIAPATGIWKIAGCRFSIAIAAARVFDDGTARFQAPIRFRCFNHRERHTVFHAAAGILAFDFQKHARAVCGYNMAQG